MSSRSADVVRDYYRVAGDQASTEADLRPLLHPELRVVEHPNRITPHGMTRTRDEVVAALLSARRLLREQRFEVHEIVVTGDRVAVRATWNGVVGVDRDSLTRGTVLVAEVASFLTVRDGQIVEQETFDCYPPFTEV